jgi:hypothetical protein
MVDNTDMPASKSSVISSSKGSQDYVEEEIEEEFYEEEEFDEEEEEEVEIDDEESEEEILVDEDASDSQSPPQDPEGGLADEDTKVTSTSIPPNQNVSFADSKASMAQEPGSVQKPSTIITKRDSNGDLVKVQRSTFPSSAFLISVAICIVLVTAGIVTGVSIAGRNKKVLDPLEVPTVSPAPTSPGETLPPTVFQPTVTPTQMPTEATETFLDLFAQVVGDAVYEDGTSAQLAADWMLTQDPAQIPLSFQSMSQSAWLQRYILVYLYYVTTNNRQTEWLSCNPPVFVGSQTVECEFSNPTEIPGGRVVYDPVPSNRWLSKAMECGWAGITCQTVPDDVTETRLAVTSIMLGEIPRRIGYSKE